MPILKDIKAQKNMSGGYSCNVRVEIENDPTSKVETVDLVVSQTNPSNPTPDPTKVTLPYLSGPATGIRVFGGVLTFDADPENYTYNMAATMKDANNDPLAPTSEESVTVQPATISQAKGIA